MSAQADIAGHLDPIHEGHRSRLWESVGAQVSYSLEIVWYLGKEVAALASEASREIGKRKAAPRH